MANKFRFKTGAKAVTTPSAPVISEDEISKLVAAKLAQMLGQAPPTIPDTNADVAFLEEKTVTSNIPSKKARLPKATTSKIVKLEEKRLVIEDTQERVDFDAAVKEFNTARGEESKFKKIVEELREAILVRMGESEVYESDNVKLIIGSSKNETISAEAVVKALVCDDNGQLQSDVEELKAGIQQLLDLSRLGVIDIKKTDFERWVKSHGYSSEPFIIKHAAKKRIVVEVR